MAGTYQRHLSVVTDGTKTCCRCSTSKPVVDFYKAQKGGFQAYCKACVSAVNKARWRTPEHRAAYKAKLATPEERRKAVARSKKTARTPEGRYRLMQQRARKKGYAEHCLSFQEYEATVRGACCVYCDSSLPEAGVGLDRLDNSRGYTADNVVPCCSLCNRTRGDSFTHAEFKVIAAAIKQVLANRSGGDFGSF